MRVALVVLMLVGCSSDPTTVVSPPSRFGGAELDAGPGRFCGVVPGAECTVEGQELARCLCFSFEEQIGRLVCCRDGHASVEACAKDTEALGCDGKPLVPRSDSGADSSGQELPGAKRAKPHARTARDTQAGLPIFAITSLSR